MKILIFCLLFLSFNFSLQAQKRNAVYVEALGNALFYSINFDHRFEKKETGVGYRVGFSAIPTSSDRVFFIPAQLNYIVGGRNALELGTGVVYSYQKEGETAEHFLFPNLALQYRYQGEQLLVRAGIAPTFTKKNDFFQNFHKVLWFWPGISIGYRF